jgi:hypothetical protein
VGTLQLEAPAEPGPLVLDIEVTGAALVDGPVRNRDETLVIA